MEFNKIKLGVICEKIEQRLGRSCFYTINPRCDEVTFTLLTDNDNYSYTADYYKLDLLTDDEIANMAITSFDNQMNKSKTFVVKILPFDRTIREDKQLIFEDVSGVITGDYPKVEIQKASEPLKVTMIVPEGYYLIEDHT